MTNDYTTSTRKIALVTGGSRGIGRNTVESLAKGGVHTIFTYHSHSADAEAVVAAVRDAGAQGIALQLDAGNVASFDAFVESMKDALAKLGAPRFDFLVNNAGNNHRNMPFEKATEEEFDSVCNVHFKGVFFLTQKLLPLINDGGRIINISTARTRTSSPGGAVSASGKGVGRAQDCRQCGCAGPGRNRFQRRHRSRQSCCQQDDCRKYGTRPGRSARRSRPDDRVASLRRESLGQRAADRGRRRSRNLTYRIQPPEMSARRWTRSGPGPRGVQSQDK